MHLQLKRLVEGGVERLLDDLRLLHGLVGEEVTRTQLDQHERVAQTVRVERDHVAPVQN